MSQAPGTSTAAPGTSTGVSLKKVQRTASTKAIKPRTAWCPVVVKTKSGLFEIHILWKAARNNVKLYKDKTTKQAFGRVVKAEIVTEPNPKNETHDYYKITNEYGDSVLFRKTLMSPALLGSNTFSKMMISSRCKDFGDQKLALFMSRLSRSKDFSHHDANSYTSNGLKLESLTPPGLDDKKEEFESFMDAAKEHAVIVKAGVSEAEEIIADRTNRKRKTDTNVKKNKLSKQERIDKFFGKEIADPKGVEHEYLEKFRGRADIKIDNLEISGQVHIAIDEVKVQQLAIKFLERFDPAQLTLTVVPADIDSFKENKMEENKYEVVHGRHRLLALKLLKARNKLKELPMMSNETCTVYILGVQSLSGVNYANIRGNEISAAFVKKPNHHDLSSIILGLSESLKDSVKVKEVIVRYSNILQLSDALKTALRSICAWPVDCLELLVSILSKYEVFETADTDEALMKKSQRLIQEGKKLVLPLKMFNELTKIPHELLREHGGRVTHGKLSIKLLIKGHTDIEVRKKKVAKIEEVSGYKSIDVLRIEFPDKFSEAVVDKFPTLKLSSKEQSLENYTRRVVSNQQDSGQQSLDELNALELEEDLREMNSLFKYARRSGVKEELGKSIARFEKKIKEVKIPKEDPYKFIPDQTLAKTFSENMDCIQEDIDKDLEVIEDPKGDLEVIEDLKGDKVDGDVEVDKSDQERYKLFKQLLHKCYGEENHAQSLEINIIRSFFVKLECKNPFNTAEIDACIDKMEDEDKVMRSDDIVFII